MVLMLPLTLGSGNVAKTYSSLADIPVLLDSEDSWKLCLLSRRLEHGLFFGFKFTFYYFKAASLAGYTISCTVIKTIGRMSDCFFFPSTALAIYTEFYFSSSVTSSLDIL